MRDWSRLPIRWFVDSLSPSLVTKANQVETCLKSNSVVLLGDWSRSSICWFADSISTSRATRSNQVETALYSWGTGDIVSFCGQNRGTVKKAVNIFLRICEWIDVQKKNICKMWLLRFWTGIFGTWAKCKEIEECLEKGVISSLAIIWEISSEEMGQFFSTFDHPPPLQIL